MTKRLRLLGLTVQPHLVIDDGENLEEVQAQPIPVRAADLDSFVASLRQQLAEEESKLNETA